METATNPYMSLPGITAEELTMLQQTTVGLSYDQQKYFFAIYADKRKSPDDVKMFCILAIIIPGIQRLMLDQVDWAIVYFFTGGLFFVMTIMDLVNYKTLAIEFNQKMAYQSLMITQMGG